MDSNIVCIDDLKEYDDKIRNWISRKYVQIGANSTISKPKISVVTDLPASPDAYTIYFVKNDPTPPETYSISPTSKTFGWNDTSEQSFQVTNSSGVLQTIKSVSLSGGNSDKFTARYSGTTAYCNPNGNNTSGSNYTTTLIVTATTPDGDKTFNVSIVQETGTAESYYADPDSVSIAYNQTTGIQIYVRAIPFRTVPVKRSELLDGTHFILTTQILTAVVNAKGINTSGSPYTDTVRLYFDNNLGIEQYIDVPVIQASGSAETYTIEPTSKTFAWDNTSEQNFVVKNSGGVAQTIKSVSLSGSNSNRFSARYSGTNAFCKPIGNNSSGADYGAVLTVVAQTPDGDKTFTVGITQEYQIIAHYLTVWNELLYMADIEFQDIKTGEPDIIMNCPSRVNTVYDDDRTEPIVVGTTVIIIYDVIPGYAPNTIKLGSYTLQKVMSEETTHHYQTTEDITLHRGDTMDISQ